MHCHTQGRPDCDDDVEGLYDEDDGDDKDDDDGDLPTVLVCGAMFVLSARLFRGCLQFVFGSDLFLDLGSTSFAYILIQVRTKLTPPWSQIIAKGCFLHLLVALSQLVEHIELLSAMGDDIYIMMQFCLSVTKNDHFLLGVSCNHLNPH